MPWGSDDAVLDEPTWSVGQQYQQFYGAGGMGEQVTLLSQPDPTGRVKIRFKDGSERDWSSEHIRPIGTTSLTTQQPTSWGHNDETIEEPQPKARSSYGLKPVPMPTEDAPPGMANPQWNDTTKQWNDAPQTYVKPGESLPPQWTMGRLNSQEALPGAPAPTAPAKPGAIFGGQYPNPDLTISSSTGQPVAKSWEPLPASKAELKDGNWYRLRKSDGTEYSAIWHEPNQGFYPLDVAQTQPEPGPHGVIAWNDAVNQAHAGGWDTPGSKDEANDYAKLSEPEKLERQMEQLPGGTNPIMGPIYQGLLQGGAEASGVLAHVLGNPEMGGQMLHNAATVGQAGNIRQGRNPSVIDSGTQDAIAGGIDFAGKLALGGGDFTGFKVTSAVSTYYKADQEAKDKGMKTADRIAFATSKAIADVFTNTAFEKFGGPQKELADSIKGEVSESAAKAISSLPAAAAKGIAVAAPAGIVNAAIDQTMGMNPDALNPDNIGKTLQGAITSQLVFAGVSHLVIPLLQSAPEIVHDAIDNPNAANVKKLAGEFIRGNLARQKFVDNVKEVVDHPEQWPDAGTLEGSGGVRQANAQPPALPDKYDGLNPVVKGMAKLGDKINDLSGGRILSPWIPREASDARGQQQVDATAQSSPTQETGVRGEASPASNEAPSPRTGSAEAERPQQAVASRTYKFESVTEDGERAGTFDAKNDAEAMAMLRDNGHFVTKLSHGKRDVFRNPEANDGKDIRPTAEREVRGAVLEPPAESGAQVGNGRDSGEGQQPASTRKVLPPEIANASEEDLRSILSQMGVKKGYGKKMSREALLDKVAEIVGQQPREQGASTDQADVEKQTQDLFDQNRQGEPQAQHFGVPLSPATAHVVNKVQAEIDTLPKWSDFKASINQWSAEYQRLGQESKASAKDLQTQVKDPVKREAITNWIEAGGDEKVLVERAAQSKGKLKAGYEAATKLTDQELHTANDVGQRYADLLKLGRDYGMDINEVDNYVNHLWDKDDPGRGPDSSKKLKSSFQFAKQRYHESYFAGEQAGKTPVSKDIAKLFPTYQNELMRVISDRKLVSSMGEGKASDGRPLLSPTGIVQEVEGPTGSKAVFMQHDTPQEQDHSDYRRLDQPALHDWFLATKDEDGNPVYMKGDLRVHPEIYSHLKNVLGTSPLREWWNSPSESAMGTAGKRIAKFLLDDVQQTAKQTMLGFLTPFHQVQEGTHALGHRVNPFSGLEPVDLTNPAHFDAARHGLMLQPDRVSGQEFMEGVGGGSKDITANLVGLFGKPGKQIKETIFDGYRDYLFHQYIPALKLKTYNHMVERNNARYDSELKDGSVSSDQIKYLSAQQSNAAYGHLNYTDMGRNPLMQHMMHAVLLAPDFLEARARFTGQALKGATSRTGREQLAAIAVLAGSQYIVARLLNKTLDDDYHWDKPFAVVHGNREYSIRSVPGDLANLVTKTRQFIEGRLSPIVGRGTLEALSGVNYRKEPIESQQILQDLVAGSVPINLQPFLRGLSTTTKNQPVKPIEQMLGSLGIHVSRFSPITEMHGQAADWIKAHGAENGITPSNAVYPVSKYQQLRYALEDNDNDRARQEMKNLMKSSGETPDKLNKGAKASLSHPFTGSKKTDKIFKQSLDDRGKTMYDAAKKRQGMLQQRFSQLLKETNPEINAKEVQQAVKQYNATPKTPAGYAKKLRAAKQLTGGLNSADDEPQP